MKKKFKWDKLVLGRIKSKDAIGLYVGIFQHLYTFTIEVESDTRSKKMILSWDKATRHYSND